MALKVKVSHPWDLSPRDARALQAELAARVITQDALGEVRRVAGVDVGFEQEGQVTRAAVAVLAYPGLSPLDYAIARCPTRFPYVPGLLSFREVPALVAALQQVQQAPDLILCDGQGRAHPRRFGVACHLGVVLDRPTIGVAKSRLCGEHDPVPDEKGVWVPLRDGGEVIGAVLRTRVGVKPVYVSVGHRVSLETAVTWVMRCVTRYRLPETTRWAHRLASHGEAAERAWRAALTRGGVRGPATGRRG